MIRSSGTNNVLVKDQTGIILLLALLTTLMISIVAIAMINTGNMNFKISHYDILAEQAQMGCDAGVDWVNEKVFAELNEPQNLTAYELPTLLEAGNQSMSFLVANDWCNVAVGPITREAYPSPSACQYEYTVTAAYSGAAKKVLVKVVYDFDGGKTQLDPGGNPFFVPRQYTNRGHIVTYQTNY